MAEYSSGNQKPPELTSENVMMAVEGVSWDIFGIWLFIPESKRDEIQRLYSDDSMRCQALIQYWLDLDPSPSWKRVITALDSMPLGEGSEIADRIRSYAEPLTEPPELTCENIVMAVEGVRWRSLGIYLSIPRSKLDEIQRLYSDDSKRCQALIRHWLDLDPSPSWRRVITALDSIPLVAEVADKIRSYAEPLTDPTLTSLNITTALATVQEWETLCNVLKVRLPKRDEINRSYSTLHEKNQAAVLWWLKCAPGSSWARLAHRLYHREGNKALQQTLKYLKRPTDATLTLSNLSTAVKAVDDWHTLGQWLGVPQSRLGQLRQQASDSVTGKQMMLLEWLTSHPAPSWDIVTEALYQGGYLCPKWHSILMEVNKLYGRDKLNEEKERQSSLLDRQLSQQIQENLKIREENSELKHQLKTASEEHQQEKLLIQQEKHGFQEECARLQQQLVQRSEELQQEKLLIQQEKHGFLEECARLQQQLVQRSEEHQQEKLFIQQECTRLQQQLVQRSEAAAQAEVQHRQEIEELQQRLDTALAEMQQLRPSSRTQVLVEEIDPWKVSRDKVQILSEMGRGAWGWVAKGRFRGQLVAVKSPHLEILDEHTTKRLQREVGIMTQVRHPNLLRIIAAVFDNQVPRLPPLIVTELLDMNLRAAYQNNRLSEASRIPIFRDVAYALHYLHEHQEPIIHRDVSAPNVLLEELPNSMFNAKVSDFGSANLAKLAQTLAEGAIIYAAPETFPPRDLQSRPPPQTTKIDVYSYGILLCEVITCQLPDPQRLWSMLQEVKSKWSFMHDLVISCTCHSPEDRLSMAQVLDKLNQLPRAQPRQARS